MPGATFKPGGSIGGYGVSRGPSSSYQSGSIVRVNGLNDIAYYHMKNFWPTTDGDITLFNSLSYYWDAAVPYSNPYGAGTLWYDIGPSASYLNKNNGTLTNGPTWSTVGGGSIQFDGSNDTVASFPYIISGPNDRTIGIIFQSTATDVQGLIGTRPAANTAGWGITINNPATKTIRLAHWNAGTSYALDVTNQINANTWYHLTYTYNRTAQDAYLYLNGTQIGSDLTFGNDGTGVTADLSVMGSQRAATPSTSNPFTGYIAVAYIATSVFTAANITTMHNLLKGRFGL